MANGTERRSEWRAHETPLGMPQCRLDLRGVPVPLSIRTRDTVAGEPPEARLRQPHPSMRMRWPHPSVLFRRPRIPSSILVGAGEPAPDGIVGARTRPLVY